MDEMPRDIVADMKDRANSVIDPLYLFHIPN